jgi:hypothetical protein
MLGGGSASTAKRQEARAERTRKTVGAALRRDFTFKERFRYKVATTPKILKFDIDSFLIAPETFDGVG